MTPFGDTGCVGVAGITLGGGIGWLVRKHGMTIDSLLAVEIVTADGRRRIASAVEEPDLFWAVRGAGTNFGVVTRLQFRLHPLGSVLAGDILLPATRDVLRSLVPALLAAPDELSAMPLIVLAPETRRSRSSIVDGRSSTSRSRGRASRTPVSGRWRRCGRLERRSATP